MSADDAEVWSFLTELAAANIDVPQDSHLIVAKVTENNGLRGTRVTVFIEDGVCADLRLHIGFNILHAAAVAFGPSCPPEIKDALTKLASFFSGFTIERSSLN